MSVKDAILICLMNQMYSQQHRQNKWTSGSRSKAWVRWRFVPALRWCRNIYWYLNMLHSGNRPNNSRLGRENVSKAEIWKSFGLLKMSIQRMSSWGDTQQLYSINGKVWITKRTPETFVKMHAEYGEVDFLHILILDGMAWKADVAETWERYIERSLCSGSVGSESICE